jgi:tetratricopeptide (TPR) repeat protein
MAHKNNGYIENIDIKYGITKSALPPQVIRLGNVSWAGTAEKMVDGSDPQPWHCLPFVEGSTYGLELIYPHETECQVLHDGVTIRFDIDFAREPGVLSPGVEFKAFSPVGSAKYYLFNTGLDLQPPPGYVLRTEPHPRFFTDDTGTVPMALIGHLQNEWYPRTTFVVFRAPRPGQRHIFRKGEPFVQILVVPQRLKYGITRMTAEEAAYRRELDKTINALRSDIADNIWSHPDGCHFNNHYKVLARAFALGGIPGLEEALRGARERRESSIPKSETIPEKLAVAEQLVAEHNYELAAEVYAQVLSQDPQSAEAFTNLGICFAALGIMAKAHAAMVQAIALEPRVPQYHRNLGELLRRLGRFPEAEASLRAATDLSPNDPGTWSILGLTLAQQGRTAEGLQAYRAWAALGYPFPGIHVKMGTALAEQSLYAEARACYEAALAIDPGFDHARRALNALPASAP